MKVLLISYHFPPDPAVGSLRTGRIARALADAGHDVHVIAPVLVDAYDEPGPSVTIHRVRRRRNAREIALALRDALRRRRSAVHVPGAGNQNGGYITAENIPQWKRFLVAMALLPDDQQGFILPAVTRAVRLHARHRFDLLYTSGPPHSAHVGGLMVKKLTRIRWAAEFRDPWLDNAMQPRYARSDIALRIKRWLERSTLTSADHVVAVSERAGRLFADKAPENAQRVVVIRNGISAESVPPTPVSEPGCTRITYLGNLYHRRDPRPLLRGLAALRRSGRLGSRRVEVDFYGHCRWYHLDSVEVEARTLGLQDWVRFHEPIPQSETPGIMARSDLLLLLAQDQPLQIPQKLYDYLGARRPIVAFVDPDGETASMLQSAGGHYLIEAEAPQIVEGVLLQALAGEPDSVPRLDPLTEWSTERELDRLMAILEARTAEGVPTNHMLRKLDSGERDHLAQPTVGL